MHRCEWRERGIGEGPPAGGIIRFKTPADRTIAFEDLIRGSISFESNLLGDFSMAKDLATPLYNFAVVIDDQAMNISHVIRGEDHVSNTPKQILIQEALGWMRPAYAHLPLILGPDRAKLSGRHGATAIREFREAGYLPEALVNFMALLGWNPGGDRELFSLPELIREFDLKHVQKSGAVFNIEKLDWMNGEYIRRAPLAELTRLARPYLEAALPEAGDAGQDYIEQVLALERPRMRRLAEIGEKAYYFFRTPVYDRKLLRWKTVTDAEIMESLERSEKIIKLKVKSEKLKANELEAIFFDAIGEGDKGKLLWPLRVALSGKKASPGPFEIMAILGKSETLERIDLARQKISEDLAR